MLQFQQCINNPPTLPSIKDFSNVTKSVSNILTDVKEFATQLKSAIEKKIQSVENDIQTAKKIGYVREMLTLIIENDGLVQQIDKLRKCFIQTIDAHKELATKLDNAFVPYIGMDISYFIGYGVGLEGNAMAQLNIALNYDIEKFDVVDTFVNALMNKDLSSLETLLKAFRGYKT